MCSHDWGKKFVIGNLMKDRVIDIWKNQKYQFARKNF